jgi:Carboxylesterase family
VNPLGWSLISKSRLGPLGFLALDDGVINGNFGIADQVRYNEPLALGTLALNLFLFIFRSLPFAGFASTSQLLEETQIVSPYSETLLEQARFEPSWAQSPPSGSSMLPLRRVIWAASAMERRIPSTTQSRSSLPNSPFQSSKRLAVKVQPTFFSAFVKHQWTS